MNRAALREPRPDAAENPEAAGRTHAQKIARLDAGQAAARGCFHTGSAEDGHVLAGCNVFEKICVPSRKHARCRGGASSFRLDMLRPAGEVAIWVLYLIHQRQRRQEALGDQAYP